MATKYTLRFSIRFRLLRLLFILGSSGIHLGKIGRLSRCKTIWNADKVLEAGLQEEDGSV